MIGDVVRILFKLVFYNDFGWVVGGRVYEGINVLMFFIDLVLFFCYF